MKIGLIAYQQSFMDKMVDKWVSTWLEKRFVKDKPDEKKSE